MKIILPLFLVLTMVISCKTSTPVVANNPANDGKSFKTAIVINEHTESKGVDAEYTWIRQNRSDYKVVGQSLSYKNNKPFDIISIQFADSSEQKIYFDISSFYGNYK